MLYGWKDNSVLTHCLAACTNLPSTVYQLFEPQVQKIAVFTYRMQPTFLFPLETPLRLSRNIIIIIISTTMFMVQSSWQSHCESSPGSFDECRMAPRGRRPKTKPDDLGCESACTGCQKLHPPSLCTSAAYAQYAVVRCGVCLSVRHVRVFCRNE